MWERQEAGAPASHEVSAGTPWAPVTRASVEKLCTLRAGDLAPCIPHSQGTLIPFWASGLTSGSWMLARIYDPELLFISSGSKRFGWEVFQFPPGLDQTAQISKGESPLSSWVLRALECDGEPHAASG